MYRKVAGQKLVLEGSDHVDVMLIVIMTGHVIFTVRARNSMKNYFGSRSGPGRLECV